MIPQEAIKEEALRRYDGDVDGQTGALIDDWGYSECQRRAFVAGALFASTEARAAELEAAAEHEASRSQTFMNTMEHMVESREYDHDDILRYGAYSAEAQTSAYWLRARAAAIRAEES